MSCYERETASIVLPASEAAKVKKAVRDAVNGLRADAQAYAAAFWDGQAKRTRSTRRYLQALEDASRERTGLYAPRGSRPRWAGSGHYGNEASWALESLLHSVSDKPRKITSADLDRFFPKATNRDTRFRAGEEAGVCFDGRVLTWEVGENNHSVERFHAHPVAVALLGALDRVKWTRGTGGVVRYDNEYSRDAWQAPSIKAAYGPAGDQQLKASRGF